MIKLTQDKSAENLTNFEKPETLGEVRAWSYSALKVYEECPYRTYISRVKGIKEPSGAAADRGTQIHQYAEDYVNGTMGEMATELFKFKSQFEDLRQGFIDGKVELEGEWAFDLDWKSVGWMQEHRKHHVRTNPISTACIRSFCAPPCILAFLMSRSQMGMCCLCIWFIRSSFFGTRIMCRLLRLNT